MIKFFMCLVLFAGLLGYFQVNIWIMYGLLTVLLVFFIYRNPLILGKNVEKMLAYLKKSKAPHLQFLYYFLHGDLSNGEKAKEKIRSKKLKLNSELMLLIERKQYGKAKELIIKMGGHKSTWYALSYIAIQEGNTDGFNQYKGKIKDSFLINMLGVDRAVYDGKREEAVTLLDNMTPKLRGYSLLTAVQYRKQILEEKV